MKDEERKILKKYNIVPFPRNIELLITFLKIMESGEKKRLDHIIKDVSDAYKSKKYTDKELLDFLQEITDKNNYTGKVILRNSTTGRGWRLHETSLDGVKSVRQAIINYIEYNMEENLIES